MSSFQTCRTSSKGAYDDAHELILEQTTRQLPQDSTGSLKRNGDLVLTYHDSDRNLSAEEGTRLEPRQHVITATSDSHPVGRLSELKRDPTGTENMNYTGALLGSEQTISSRGSKARRPEVFDVECTNRTAGPTSQNECSLSRAVENYQRQSSNGKARASVNAKSDPLAHRSKASSVDDACLAVATRDEFQEQMKRTPAEICQVIMDMVFEEAFGPRAVHPHRDPPIMNIFLSLDRDLYRRYHEQYWIKNTWIISKGPLNKTMRFMTEKPYNETTTEFSLQTPNKAALQIRSVQLSFSSADTPELPEWQQLARHSETPYIVPTRRQDAARLERAQRYDEIQRQLIHTWQDKFDRIAMLDLRHLTLDFTEAYDPRGSYLGVYLVRRLIPFAHGIPSDFKILVPDSWLEWQTGDAFSVLNAS